MRGHEDRVVSVAYSPDGGTIASASRDETIRLWNVESGQQVGDALTAHTDDVDSVGSAPMASASSREHRRYRPGLAGRCRTKELCDKLTENMSQKQWDEWVSPDIDYIKVCPDLPIRPD